MLYNFISQPSKLRISLAFGYGAARYFDHHLYSIWIRSQKNSIINMGDFGILSCFVLSSQSIKQKEQLVLLQGLCEANVSCIRLEFLPNKVRWRQCIIRNVFEKHEPEFHSIIKFWCTRVVDKRFRSVFEGWDVRVQHIPYILKVSQIDGLMMHDSGSVLTPRSGHREALSSSRLLTLFVRVWAAALRWLFVQSNRW